MPTAAPGIWPWPRSAPTKPPRSALEQAGLRARQRSAYAVSSRAFERGALLAPEEIHPGRLLYAAADAAWLGGLADRAAELLDEARQRAVDAGPRRVHRALARPYRRPARADRDAQEILLAAADLAAPTDPERAVEMLAEAVSASFYAGDATTMRLAADRAAAAGTARRERPHHVLRADARREWRRSSRVRAIAARPRSARRSRRWSAPTSGTMPASWSGPRWTRLAPRRARQPGAGRPGARRRAPQSADRGAAVRADLRGLRPGRHRPLGRGEACFHEAIGLARETGQRTELGTCLARLAVAGSEARQVRPEPPARRRVARPVPRVWPRPVRGLGDHRAGRSRARLRPSRARPRPLRGAAGRAPLA